MLTMGLPVIKPKKATDQTLNFAEETFCPNPHTEGSQIDTSYKYIKSRLIVFEVNVQRKRQYPCPLW